MTTRGDSGSDDLRRKVTRSIGWVVAERWGSRLLQLLVMAVLTRLVAPEDFGVVAMASSIITVLQVVVDSGFQKSLIQLKELEEKDASTAFWTSLGISALVYAALYFTAPLIAGLMGSAQLTDVLRVLGVSLPLWALSQTPAALLEREFNFKVLSIRQLIAATVGAVAAVPVGLIGGGVWAIVTQMMATAGVACLVLWASTPWRPKFHFSLRSLRRIWPIGMSIMGTELLDAASNNLDKIVLGLFFAPDVLGYYYLAQRVVRILTELVTTVISRVSLTAFSRVQDDLPRLNRIFRQLTFAAGLIGVPAFGLTAVLAPQIIPFAFGPHWEQSIPIIWGLSAGSVLVAVMYFDRTVLLARGKAKSAFWLSALQNVTGTALIFALLPLGVTGVVISRWTRVFVWPVRLAVLRRAIDLDVWRYIAQIGRTIVAMVPVIIPLALLQMTPWAQSDGAVFTFALPMGVLALAGYGAIAWAIAGEENRAVLRPMLRGVARKLSRR